MFYKTVSKKTETSVACSSLGNPDARIRVKGTYTASSIVIDEDEATITQILNNEETNSYKSLITSERELLQVSGRTYQDKIMSSGGNYIVVD